MWMLLLTLCLTPGEDDYFHDPFAAGKIHRTTIETTADPSLRVVVRGKAGNLELQAAEQPGIGQARVNYQRGFGYLTYDRRLQTLTFEGSRRFTFKRTSRWVMRRAPYAKAELPKEAVVELDVKMSNLGYGSFNFSHLSVTRLSLDVGYGDIDLSFPTENQSVVRDQVLFRLLAGDLELNQLGNLKASDIRIQGGLGVLMVDFGPKVHQNMDVTFDQDIGSAELRIPRGTHVVVKGTRRNLEPFGLDPVQTWHETTDHQNELPLLTLDLRGPIGKLNIVWI
jgi:hypothetical protein